MKQFRGVSDIYIAEVITDDGTDYITGAPERLCYAATVGKEVSSDSATVYLDNKPMLVINSEGSDEISISGSALELSTLSKVTGKKYDTALDMFVDGERNVKYFALGYKEKMTDGSYRYNWRLKGTFAIPGTEANTEDDGTDSTGQELTYTGIMTDTTFTKADNGAVKGIVVTDTKADVSDWFEEVKTPDTVTARVSA